MKILLIDNEDEIRAGLKQMILECVTAPVLIEEANGVATGLSAIKRFNPDIVFLDIEMDDGTGFDMMKQVSSPAFQLIFTTAHNKYAVTAFKFSAIDYLLKPIDPEELLKSIVKAGANILQGDLAKQLAVLMQQLTHKNEHERKIVLKDIDGTYFVKVNDILFCEAEGTYTKFYFTNSNPILVSKNLKEYESMLEPLGFIRTHHSYLANPEKIKMYDKADGGSLLLDGGLSIPVSQRKKDVVLGLLESRG